MIDYRYSYLFGTICYLLIWLFVFFYRKDLRKEIWTMSVLVGILSFASNYYWWNIDWWNPQRFTNTSVGIEDFLIGFTSGGVIAVIYEEMLQKRYYRKHLRKHVPGSFSILLLLGMLTSWLFWGVGLTSFVASTVSLTTTAGALFYFRKDLLMKGLFTGFLSVIISFIFYFPIMLTVPNWVGHTYLFDYLSGILVLGIPIEELVFWFLAGLVFGPFYEYWQGLRLRKLHS